MRKILVMLVAALTASQALAAPMVKQASPPAARNSVTWFCAAGTTCDDPTATTDGMSTKGVMYVSVYVCADSGSTISTGGPLEVWFMDAADNLWAVSDLTLTVKTGKRCAYAIGSSPGKGIPVLDDEGRMAVIPKGTAVTPGGGITVKLRAIGVDRARR